MGSPAFTTIQERIRIGASCRNRGNRFQQLGTEIPEYPPGRQPKTGLPNPDSTGGPAPRDP
jgi:hypothetical protein